jgi:hypothetical protein
MSLLVLDAAKERAREIVDYARRTENWYKVGETSWIPGDRSEFVLISGTVRAVFSWTQVEARILRHMSVSVMGPRLPNPSIVWTLAGFFEFTGVEADAYGVVDRPAATWGIWANEEEHCIVVQEEINPSPKAS